MKKVLALSSALLFSVAPSFATMKANPIQFGGTGSSGIVAKTGTSATIEDINATGFSVASGQTWNAQTGTRVNAQREITIAGTINVSSGFSGPPGQQFSVAYGVTAGGSGPGGGANSETAVYGGNGGGFGGLGGAGGSGDTAAHPDEGGGRPYQPWVFPSGSAGGAGHFNHNDGTGTGGAGGSAGGGIRFISGKTITVASGAVINLAGGAGGNGVGSQCSGGGGGSGGYALFTALEAIYLQGTNCVNVSGGNGGNSTGQVSSAGAGGGGAGGWVILIAPSVSVTGSVNKTGGTPGTPVNTGRGAASGGDGITLILQQPPTLPLIAFLENSDILPFIRAKYQGYRTIRLTQSEFKEITRQYFTRKVS